jgi:hypothetical protein
LRHGKWHEKRDWDRKFLDRISGFAGFTGFYIKDGDSFRFDLMDGDGDAINYVDLQD